MGAKIKVLNKIKLFQEKREKELTQVRKEICEVKEKQLRLCDRKKPLMSSSPGPVACQVLPNTAD